MNQFLPPQSIATLVDYGAGLRPGERRLSHYAASARPSRGRVFDEPACPTRSDWQRDRDRVLHSATFRRLMYKTQMFVFHEGDHYRTRMTHTLEVAQIARTVARQLLLDEDLAEVLALAHDLGHPPFGHAGERALDAVIAPVGGFDHNVQSFRIVTQLETRYADFDGLNLTWESLEGLIKHNGPPALSERPEDARVVASLAGFQKKMDLQLERFASAEAQVAALADDIAWHTHDIDDGLRAGLIELSDLGDVQLLRQALSDLKKRPQRERSRDIYELVRVLITQLVADVVRESRVRLRRLEPSSPEEIRDADGAVVGFSPTMFAQLKELRAFLFDRLYHHRRVMDVMDKAQGVVRDLVEAYAAGKAEMPDEWGRAAAETGDGCRLRLVGDFVAGMTDRYAIEQHRALFDHTPELR
ncbi:MAG: deoxyguanosinetriphosphate triphosphohydrolase [Hyphomicrobiaceae bacterium]